ncbi:MAG: hypothetical protein OEM82_13975 [Acidobacteriota bacterium]|nr:hypothetical protein [Acidobacteriota bacterium]MDH3530107.1 hypothetical protein [Acidobacteriota bacterium]
MNCRDFQEIADSYLSDELLTETNHDMIRHMEACSACRDIIAARREIRTRLRSAVIASPLYRPDEGFEHLLLTRIKHDLGDRKPAARTSWFGLRPFAMAAGLLVVAMLSFVLFTNLDLNGSASKNYLVSNYAEESLLNIASGDHQHCAIDHNLQEPPVSLAEGDGRYAGLDGVVKKEFSTVLADHKLVEAHSCKFKDVTFAHLVMQGPNNTLSVLVAPSDKELGSVNEKIAEFASPSYRISKFDVEKDTVFVISTLQSEKNLKAAEALAVPLRDHFTKRKGVQTAMFAGPYYKFAFHRDS